MATLEIHAANVRYGKVHAVRDVDLTVDQGEVVVVVGPNGAGKSSLMGAISGIVALESGRLEFEGADISGMAPHKIARRGLIQVPEGRHIFAPLTVEENLMVGAYARKGKQEIRDDLDKIFGMFPILEQRRDGMAGLLSGGEQQMLAFGRALMGKPHILLIDEPSMGLAPALVDQVIAAIARIASEGIAILMVEQNAHAAFGVADRAYVLDQGTVVLTGAASDVSSDPRVVEAFLGVAEVGDRD
ncbi:ABC transporter ATP-binding protein [Aeromicrobium fastidiosum]|uniref:ABC transporter ATP-binding protein n=1 Tax=Aeromicrobium TaxID=2040 RepID=UPI00177F5C15|nr:MULTISPECIES: ABC transporter ATP-binding protein [Aeromicrobium]MBD8605489.1 ABC transporter ATP-binding protein [Aeromicrobium sp. CFBP 8757]MCL8250406.1 ABC transporter ATP-binding protein [Aeromicrobium fastidiosum]